MRLLLRSFAFLDFVSLVFISMQLWNTATHYEQLPDKFSVKLQAVLLFPMAALVVFGAIGLFFIKKYGFILYYIQFPFRLYLWVFSLGFITLLPSAFEIYDDGLFDPLLKICFMAEFIRLYLTIRTQLKASRATVES